MQRTGLQILAGEHPIVPVMLGEAALAGKMAEVMLAKGVYVIGFCTQLFHTASCAFARKSLHALYRRLDLCHREVRRGES